MPTAQDILKQYFGYDSFRPGQDKLVQSILSGRDTLGIMPTGAGKSICYQVPALLLPGLTLVISPLISLMKDQVGALNEAGVPAACVNSAMSAESMRDVLGYAAQGGYKLLYVAPERLTAPAFLSFAQRVPVSMVTVDEAHCISQWGQDFRPSYLKILDFLAALPARPLVSAFTATATEAVRDDIVRALGLRDPFVLTTGFDRPNLYFAVERPPSKPNALLRLLATRTGKSGIVYCATRKTVDDVCDMLLAKGLPATRYHAGLCAEERQRNQEDFLYDVKPIMVATNAFGMGIDKSNVSFVIHYNMPKSLEAYYQEAGRAGRDGEPADCILLYSAGDITTAKFLLENSGNEELDEEEQEQVRRQDQARLQAMIGYCRTSGCLRGRLLDYFGQAHGPACGNCGNCRGEYQLQDITVPAQMILSCVHRVKGRLGYYVGKTLLVQVLRGSRNQRVADLGLDQLSTYGLLSRLPAEQVRTLMDFLEAEGLLRTNPLHATLEPTPAAAKILFQGEKLSMPVRKDRAGEARRAGRKKTAAPSPAPATSTIWEKGRVSWPAVSVAMSAPWPWSSQELRSVTVPSGLRSAQHSEASELSRPQP